ncbi:hypothetical protein EON65_20845 [archaeon]|nr:MAG: hypothetical protein EON65_20845 [archaeon]
MIAKLASSAASLAFASRAVSDTPLGAWNDPPPAAAGEGVCAAGAVSVWYDAGRDEGSTTVDNVVGDRPGGEGMCRLQGSAGGGTRDGSGFGVYTVGGGGAEAGADESSSGTTIPSPYPPALGVTPALMAFRISVAFHLAYFFLWIV